MERQSGDTFDLAVIGAGPCGLAVGIAAVRADLTTVLFERGCVVNALVGFPLGMTYFSTPENLELGDLPFVCRGDKPTRGEALKYYRRVAQHFRLNIHQYEKVLSLAGGQGEFVLRTRQRHGSEHEYRARDVVVATGNFDTPNLLGVPGEDLAKVTHYYREGHPYYDQDCLVIGGGNSAVEAALDLNRSGAAVTLVHFLEGLDDGVKPWVRPDLENRIREGSIAARFRTRVVEIGPDFVILRDEKSARDERLRNDWVFAMTGYAPDIKFLRKLGIEVAERSGVPAHDPDTMESNVPGIYIAGVLAAGYDANRLFIENCRSHGERIVRRIRGDGCP